MPNQPFFTMHFLIGQSKLQKPDRNEKPTQNSRKPFEITKDNNFWVFTRIKKILQRFTK